MMVKFWQSLKSKIGSRRSPAAPETSQAQIPITFSRLIDAASPKLLNYIWSFTSTSQDLLSLSLTSRKTSELVMPQLLDRRPMRCGIQRLALWKHLADHPKIASRILSLEIVAEGDENSPLLLLPAFIEAESISDEVEFDWELYGDTKIEATVQAFDQQLEEYIRALTAAISQMKRLESFLWNIESRPTDEVLAALKESCPSLTTIQVFDKDVRERSLKSENDLGPKVCDARRVHFVLNS